MTAHTQDVRDRPFAVQHAVNLPNWDEFDVAPLGASRLLSIENAFRVSVRKAS